MTQDKPAKKAAATPAKKTAATPDKGSSKSEAPTLGPRPDEVENLSSAKAKPQQGAGGDPAEVAKNIEKAQQEGSVVSGPNHDLPDPTPEHTARPPASTVNLDSKSGPLEPPKDALLQRDPPQGYGLSSTDHSYAAAGGRTIAGERYEGLEGPDGKGIKIDGLFDEGDGSKTFVTVKPERVYEVFYYPNTVEKAKRLLFVGGQQVNRAEAERLKRSLTRSEAEAKN